MSLRAKILVVVTVLLVLLVGGLQVVVSGVLLEGFAHVEEQDARQNVQRVLEAITDEMGKPDFTANDWGAWDDTYAFIADHNETYLTANLNDETIIRLNFNAMAYVDVRGDLVFDKGLDTAHKTVVPIPEGLRQEFKRPGSLLLNPDFEKGRQGLLLLPEGPLMLAARQILTGKGEGPSRGTLVFGRYLDAGILEAVAKRTHVQLTLFRLDDPNLTAPLQHVIPAITTTAPIIIRPDARDQLMGYALLSDLYAKPVLLLRVSMPRPIYQQGLRTIRYLIASGFGVWLGFFVVLLLFLEYAVLRRVAKLDADVRRIGAAPDASARVVARGSDELAQLGHQINTMLASLARSQEDLRSSEARYRSVVDKAQDVIFTITPEGTVTSLNLAFGQITGWAPEAWIGKPFGSMVHPDDRPLAVEMMQRVHAGETLPVFELRVSTKRGEYMVGEFTAVLLKHRETGVGILGIARDITHRKELEATAALQQEQLHRANATLHSKMDELQQLNRIMMGREERILELKAQVKILQAQAPGHAEGNGEPAQPNNQPG